MIARLPCAAGLCSLVALASLLAGCATAPESVEVSSIEEIVRLTRAEALAIVVEELGDWPHEAAGFGASTL